MKQRFNWSGRLGKAALGCFLAGQVLFGWPLPGGSLNQAHAASDASVVGTWMWDPYVIGKDKDGTLQKLMNRGVNRVYLFIDPTYAAESYRNFIKDARSKGIEVRAMSGAPNWVLPEYNKKMYEFIDWVVQYNKNSQPDERFAGIHLDVEPYVTAQWRQDSDAVIGLWVDTVSGFAEQVKADSGSELSVGIDMPVWLEFFNVPDGHGGRTTLSNRLMRLVDQVTLMAYSDNAKDITDSVKVEMGEADRAGVPVLVAVDTVNTGEPGTFYDKGNTAMMSELNTAAETLRTHPSYKGYNIHQWETWEQIGE